MAKLYWRIKRNGKWTWVAATPENTGYDDLGSFPQYIGPYQLKRYTIIDERTLFKPEVYTDE